MTKKAREICQRLLVLAVFSKLGDYWQVQLQGTIRALGVQKAATNHNLIAYWLLNLPLAVLLSMWPLHFGYDGLWIAISAAQYYLAVFLTVLIKDTDWHERAREAEKRGARDEKDLKIESR